MTGRSLCCSSEGIKQAKRALIRNSLIQKALAEELGITRQPVGKFFTGKPVDRNLFVHICDKLGLEWEEVVAEPFSELEPKANQDTDIDIDALVQKVREKIRPCIQERCGTMRVLDMSQPIGLNDIYTTVNILEKITGQRRKKITQLLQECKLDNFERFGLGRITEKRVLGLEAVKKYSKLIILGKPGAGKTTFLKSVAFQCIEGEFQAEQVPIFITLKDFAETTNRPGLLEYIDVWRRASCLPHQSLVQGGQDAQPTNSSITENLLIQGRMLILLDGLDEVREEDSRRILKEIRDFSGRFCDNHFVMTCRIAAREYTFDKFTEVEVADFDNQQISTFATNWFNNKAVKAETFIKHLQKNQPIQELATNPLLLTLLCLVFEETGNFPANRSELYKEGLDTLLKKWDAKRGIEREQVYTKLSFQRKEDLLSKIAFATFELGDYFFKQKIAEQYITEYICNLPDASTAPEALQLDSEQVLKSFEAQHALLVERARGIYSFSHLTFHEYFTAREIVTVKQSSEEALQNLVSHITETRWQEVFLLAVEMSSNVDYLLQLMKQRVDALVAADEKLQQFLIWIQQKSLSINVSYKPAAVRAFYFDRSRAINIESVTIPYSEVASLFSKKESDILELLDKLAINNLDKLTLVINFDLTKNLAYEFSNTLNYIFSNGNASADFFNSSISLDLKIDFNLNLNIYYAILNQFNVINTFCQDNLFILYKYNLLLLNYLLTYNIERELKHKLEILKKHLLAPNDTQERVEKWWKDNGEAWTEQLRNVMIQYRNIGHDWQFNDEQKELLKQYYDANKLLVKCLNSDCYVSREVRQEIEDTLLLPIAEVEQRKAKSV